MTDAQHPKESEQVQFDLDQQKQEFERLDLQGLGLQDHDFEQVIQAHKALADIDHSAVAEYGKDIATKTSAYTDELLGLVQNKDLDETGQKLNDVVKVAQQLNASQLTNQSKGSSIPILGGLFNKIKKSKQNFDQHFSTTKQQIDALVKEIEQSQQGLKTRVKTLDQMFNAVQDEYKLLGIYVAAGKIKEQEIQYHIATLKEQTDSEQNSGQNQLSTQKIYDLNHLANNLEKRISDLQVLQHSAMQTLPMIRIIQSNNLMLVDKFYAIKNITLPAWKNQISLAISLQEQQKGVELAKNIDDATNSLLRRNAELLHQNSIDTAKANQRSVIDIETLEHVQNTLINTVNDVIEIQKEGMQKRQEAAQRIKSLQNNLTKLVIDSGPSNDSSVHLTDKKQ